MSQLRATRLQSDVEFLERENNILFRDVQDKVRVRALAAAPFVLRGMRGRGSTPRVGAAAP